MKKGREIIIKWHRRQQNRDLAKVAMLVFWTALIFFLSSLPSSLLASQYFGHSVIRKLAHFFEYFVLCFLSYKVFSLSDRRPFAKYLFWAVAVSVIFAFSDELHQYFVSGRQAKFLDVIIDSFGVYTMAWLIIMERAHQQRFPRRFHFIKI